jgi:ATP-dependent RNA helicase DeaD
MQKQLFPDLGIDADLLAAIEKLGFEQPSPIQAEAIPVALSGRDVVGQSQTGSGKTMAFGIPALQCVNPDDRAVQVLVMCPTRELAMQVCTELHKLTPGCPGVFATPIYGGAAYEHQIRALKKGTQIVVGTPGRILDFARRGILKLGGLRMLVFDEADEMLDMGFREDIEELMKELPETRQTIFFSATMSKPIRNLIDRHTKDPATITIEHKTLTVPTIEQRYYEVYGSSKIEVVCRILDTEGARKAIVFANTKRAVDEITDALLARGYASDRLHGDLSQTMRDRVMKNFRTGGLEILTATDVAARGLDVDDVDLIFNYDLPYDEEDYVHRIGRTGRAGREGKAVSLVTGREIYLLQRIQRYIKTNIKHCRIPSLEDVANTRVEALFGKIRSTLETAEFAPRDAMIEKLLDEGFSSTAISSAAIHLLLREGEREAEEIKEDRAPEERERPRQRRDREADAPRGEARPRERKPRGSRDGLRRTRMFINVGHVDEVSPGQIAGAIYNTVGLPQGSIGSIDIYERSSFVEIPDEMVDQVLDGIGGAKLRGRKLRMDRADNPGFKGGFTERPTRAPRGDRDDRDTGKRPFPKKKFSRFAGKKKAFRPRRDSYED